MTKENLISIENKKPFETVQEIENYQIKKSPLSPAARGKVINKSGSNYVSESRSDYGPCSGSFCPHSSSFYVRINLDAVNYGWPFEYFFVTSDSSYL